MRRMLASLAAVILLIGTGPVARAEGTFGLVVNGARLPAASGQFWYKGHAMLPLRVTFETMGYHVAYDPGEQRADLTSPLFPTMSVWAGRSLVHINGIDLPLDAPVMERDGRLFVPADLLDQLHFSSQWDDQERTLLRVFWSLPPEIDQALRLGVQEAYWRLKSFGIIKDSPTS